MLRMAACSRISEFVNLSCQWMCIIRLRHRRWKTAESLFLPSLGGPFLTAVEEGTENASLVNS